ncbi:R3H and coiled-coil domain-containing protein 1 [Cyclopterus lumpus]|uniref:R3H and coiled-coil domain-containing protein 1 n=1 Tax=Cyclopterus lumpus TaxID=8103 RepID=UPI00148620E0|nr:R3H and coiled-coil domain-containing protein 1 [Cyclopterus lumpus]
MMMMMLTWGEVSNTCTCPQEDPCLSLATLAFPCFDGLYLPKQESVFLHDVKEELEVYLQQSRRQSVLLFPPLPSRLRYLIHRTTEDLPELATFSVGDSWCRRVVVCHAELRAVEEEVGDWEGNDSFCEQPLRNREEMGGGAKTRSSFPSRGRGPKRPDKALYMPRAARERLSFQNSPEPPGDQGGPGPASSSCIGSSRDSCFSPEATEDTSPAATREQLLGAADRGADSSALCPPEENRALPLTPNEAEPLGWQQTVSCFKDMTLEEDEKGKEDVCTDADDVTEEIKAHLKEPAAVSIQHVHNDYSVYESEPVRLDKLCHVIEIYDFPHCFKTDDLVDAFTDYSDGGMKIEWVDDTHALGVFSTETAAIQALSICHPLLKARALNEGSKQAKGKANRQAEFIQPVKERPRTDSAVARRMVTRALGMQGRGRRGQRY